MNAWRVAAWIVTLGLAGAWFASAAGIVRSPRSVRGPARPPQSAALDHLAESVEAQTGRLRHRLAAAPAPGGETRNPFRFRERPVPVVRASRPQVVETPAPEPISLEPAEPSLELIGIAEKKVGDGIVRTAMLTAGGVDLIMVTPGQQLLDLYAVVTVSPDAVELKHLTNGALRRLVLK